jgi:sugar phosphate isomerase/epimerase
MCPIRFGTKLDGERDWAPSLAARLGDRDGFFNWLVGEGFGFVELACGDEPRVERLLGYARAASDAGLGVSLHPYTREGSPEGFGVGPVQEVNAQFLDLAERLADIAGQPQRLVLHAGLAGTGPYAAEYGEAARRAHEFFQWLDEEVSSHRKRVLPLCETAMPAEPADDFERLADTWQTVLEMVGGTQIPVCWDTGHAYLSALRGKHDEMPPPGFVQRVRHVHLHDVKQEGEDAYSDHHPPGQGMSPLGDYARQLAASGYEGWILFERSAHLYSDRMSLRESLADGMQMLRGAFQA